MLKLDSEPHSRNLRLHRQMCLQPRLKVIDASVASTIIEALCTYVEKRLMHLASFVVMLDHWHALFATCDGKSISQRMEILGSWVGKQTGEALAERGCEWQTGFHETRIRSAKQFRYICAYIEENPVRAGLVNSPSDWKWSSANPAYKDFLTRPWPWRFEKDI
jgi:REP-associated tyrosine transposase